MKKLFIILVLMLFAVPAFAEKVALRISPTEIISTHNDEVEVGDWLKFELINDVYYNNNLYLKKGEQVVGIVDFVHENGILCDNAEIYIKKFITKDIQGNKVIINYPLTIDRKDYPVTCFKDKVFKYGLFVFKGLEIYIEPDTEVFNIFYEK